nr:type-F conjugative transfer system secretin TraK [Shewanella sp. YLB-07]
MRRLTFKPGIAARGMRAWCMAFPMTLFFTLSLALSMTLSGHALAQNTPPTQYHFNDSETVPVVLSSVDINRLVVKDDKITSIDCPEGFCVVTGTKTDNSGAARMSLNLAAPFTAYISTAKGRHFGLFITPKAKPAVTSIFTANPNAQTHPSAFDKDSPYTSMMSEFIAQMMHYLATGAQINGYQVHLIDNTQEALKQALNRRSHKGFAHRSVSTEDPLPTPTGLTTEPAMVFTGKHFNGIIYRLTNHSPHVMPLTTAQFYSATVRAAALSTPSLNSQQVGHLFVVSGGEAMQ